MTNELHLDEFRILDVKKDEDGSMLYLVEPDGEETACLNCCKTCVHKLDSVEGDGRITIRLREQVKKEVLDSTFTAVAV